MRGTVELELFYLLFLHLYLSYYVLYTVLCLYLILQSGLVPCCLCGPYRGFLQHFSNKVRITITLQNKFQQGIRCRTLFTPVA